MYFSKVSLDTGVSVGKLARIAVSDYKVHQHIWNLFSDDPDRKRDFLYRMEKSRDGYFFYTLSNRPPEDKDGIWKIETKKYDPKVTEGERFVFSLRANPVVTKKDGAGKRKRHDVVMEAKHRCNNKDFVLREKVQELGVEWLEKRGEKNGFAVKPVVAESYCQHRLFKKAKKEEKNDPIRFSAIDFSGLLKVTDKEFFLSALYKGIGPAKGFGCGLLMIKRASDASHS